MPQVKKTKVWGDDNRSWNLFIVRFYDCELWQRGGHDP